MRDCWWSGLKLYGKYPVLPAGVERWRQNGQGRVYRVCVGHAPRAFLKASLWRRSPPVGNDTYYQPPSPNHPLIIASKANFLP